MNSAVFLTIIFLPFIFSLYLIFKRLTLSFVNKKILKFGLLSSVLISFIASVVQQIIVPDKNNIFLIVANVIFIFLSTVSTIYFEHKKQFIFTRLRYNIFLSLLISFSYVFVLSNNFILSTIVWIISGLLIYIFSFFDIFKTGSDYNSNRFYFILLSGDFLLLLVVFILMKFAIVSDNFSYILNYTDIKSILSYILGNSDFEYIIIPICIAIALFSRSFIFPFSCFFSFLTNSSNIFYLAIYSVLAPVYSLVLFLKLDLFETLSPYMQIFLVASIIFILFSLLFEKHFKIIFGYLLSVVNMNFILLYFYNKQLSYIYAILAYIILIAVISVLFIKDKLSFKKRLINKNIGFIQERIIIFLFEDLAQKISAFIDFIDKIIVRKFFAIFPYIADVIGYYYITYTQSRKINSILKGILIIFALFALFAIFIALFGNFGEMQI